MGDQPPATVVRCLEKGDQMGAIVAYRKETGAGLKEAREAVKSIAREHGLDA